MSEFKNFSLIRPSAVDLHWTGLSDVRDGHLGWEALPKTLGDSQQLLASIQEHVESGKAWRYLPYFSRAFGHIDAGNRFWGCNEASQLSALLHEAEILLRLDPRDFLHRHFQPKTFEVAIGPRGEIALASGWPRFLAALAWQLAEVPVRIIGRHPDWTAFRTEIGDYERENDGIYAPLLHVDLQDFRCWYGPERFEIIARHLDPAHRTVLDMGAHWGYCSAKLEALGFDVTAVECYGDPFYFLQKLRAAYGCRFRVVKSDIFEFVEREPRFDTVFALNLFHHFLQTQASLKQLERMLNRLEMKGMFLMAHDPEEDIMRDSFANFGPEAFAEFVLDNSCLTQYRQIGTCYSRKIFHLF